MKWAVEKEVKRIVKFSEKEVLKFSQKNKEKFGMMIRLICYKSSFYRYFWGTGNSFTFVHIIFGTIKNKRKIYWLSELQISKTQIRFWTAPTKVESKSYNNRFVGDIRYIVFDYEMETRKFCKRGRRYYKKRSPK